MGADRPAYRPPSGLPRGRSRDDWHGTAASILFHALLLALVVSPTLHAGFSASPAVGAGGPGPAGGGGGSSGGPAGERLRFIAVTRAPLPSPVVAPDVVKVQPPPKPASTSVVPPVPTTAAATAPLGAGNAAAAGGAGPGSGGGVGSGIGPGRGTGVGPGSGGGPADQYPPTPTQFFLPPLPAPDRIKPYHLIAWFDVDERGNAKLLGFNPSRDNSYNRRLREVLLELRFRPGVRADGTAVRDTVDVHYIF